MFFGAAKLFHSRSVCLLCLIKTSGLSKYLVKKLIVKQTGEKHLFNLKENSTGTTKGQRTMRTYK